MEPIDLVRPALGEVVRLGQLYNAASNSFIPEDLWTSQAADAHTNIVQLPRSELTFRQTSSIEDRSNLLDLSASLTVSYLGIEASGKAAYLQRSESRKEDVNITAAIKITTQHEALDVQQLLTSPVFSSEQLARMAATHVLTGIIYGGTYLGSITQRASSDKSKTDVSGSMSVSILEQLTSVVDASGSGALQIMKDRYSKNKSISVKIVSDIKQQDTAMLPMEVIPFLESIPLATKGLAGSRGVPQTLILTPLKLFTKFSTEVFFQELVESELRSLITFYDNLKSLYQDRQTLGDTLDNDPRSKYFPTFIAQCTASEQSFERAYTASCAKLRRFLADYRLYAATETTQEYLTNAQLLYEAQYKLIRKDQAQANLLLKLVDLSLAHGYSMVTLDEIALLEEAITADHNASTVLILIPESTSRLTLLDSFRNAHELLKLANSTSPARTYYLDAAKDEDLLLTYERPSGTLGKAISLARSSTSAIIVQYKYSPLQGYPDWQIFGDLSPDATGTMLPGVLTDSIKETRYVGTIKDGLAHGVGNMTYLDGSVYDGHWFFGLRDGWGDIKTPPQIRSYDSQVMEGTEGRYVGLFANGFTSEGTDYRLRLIARIYVEGRITAYKTPEFASNGNIQEVVNKIARHFEWKQGQRFKLTTRFTIHPQSIFWPTGITRDGNKIWISTQSIIVNGNVTEQNPYPEDQTNAWPDEDLEKATGMPGFIGRISQAQFPQWNENQISLPIEIMVEAI